MARIKGGILGNMVGKIGNVVGTVDNGDNILRTKPVKSTKREKNGPQPQNYKLGLMRSFLKSIETALEVGFKNVKNKLSTMNRAMSYNTKAGIIGKAPNFSIDYSKILISKGTREPAWAARAELIDRRTVRLSWEIPQTAKVKLIADDKVFCLCYNETTRKRQFNSAAGTRKDLSIDWNLPSSSAAGLVHIWLFFESPDGRRTSRSDYFGTVLLT